MSCSSTHAPNFLTVNLMLFIDQQKKGGTGTHTERVHFDQRELSRGMWEVHTTPAGADDGSGAASSPSPAHQ